MQHLFQDSLGTIPVTAPGQTVGLMLDKGKGLGQGEALITPIAGQYATVPNGVASLGSPHTIGIDAGEVKVVITGTVTSGVQLTVTFPIVGERCIA